MTDPEVQDATLTDEEIETRRTQASETTPVDDPGDDTGDDAGDDTGDDAADPADPSDDAGDDGAAA
jgi:hypothetical protein